MLWSGSVRIRGEGGGTTTTTQHFKLVYCSAAGVGEGSRCFLVKEFTVADPTVRHRFTRPPALFHSLFISVPGDDATQTAPFTL